MLTKECSLSHDMDPLDGFWYAILTHRLHSSSSLWFIFRML